MAFGARRQMPLSSARRVRSIGELSEGLVRTCRDGSHWCCDEDFLRVCALRRGDLEAVPKTFWGNKALWLDMLATEIAIAVCARTCLSWGEALGSNWSDKVENWLDLAYSNAIAALQHPPSRQLLANKAITFVNEVPVASGGHRVATLYGEMPAADNCSGEEECVGRIITSLQSSLRTVPSERTVESWHDLDSAPIDGDLPWALVSDVLWCHGGSGGATLLRLPPGAICVKHCGPDEFFAGRLAASLSIRTARLRPVNGVAENEAIRRAVARFKDRHEKGGHMKARPGTVLTVMEFIDGCVMMGLPAHHYLRKNDSAKSPWYELGRLMGFDMLINNFDRLPLAWSNEGNLGNVMLGSRLGAVVGIDQAVHSIIHQGGRRNYLSRVCQAIREARGHVQSTSCFSSVRAAIYTNTAAELTDSEIKDLQAGFLAFLQSVTDLTRAGRLQGIVEAARLSSGEGCSESDSSCEGSMIFREGSTSEGSMNHSCAMIMEVANVISSVLAE